MNLDRNLLVKKACSGDAEAFGELYEIYANDLYRYACYILRSRRQAQDVVQDAVCAAFSQIGSLRSPEAFKAWLFKILSNVCNKHIAELVRERNTLSLDEGYIKLPGAPETEVETTCDMKEAFDCLDAQERQIVRLSAVEGYTSREVSLILGIPAGTVRSKLSRALKKMHNELMQ